MMSLSNYQYGKIPPLDIIITECLSGLVVALASIPASITFANIAGVNPLIGNMGRVCHTQPTFTPTPTTTTTATSATTTTQIEAGMTKQ